MAQYSNAGKDDVRVDRLVEWLKDAHAMEAQAESMLKKQVGRIEHYPELKARIEQHIATTQGQAQMVEECLKRYDASYSGMKDLGGKMMAFGQAMGGMTMNDEVIKGMQMGYVFEHMEIASYRILISAAEAVGDSQTKQTCEHILQEEIAMATWFEEHMGNLTKDYLARAAAPHTESKR